MQSTTGRIELVCVRHSGERVQVTVVVGHPYPTRQGDWACPLEIAGLHGRLNDIVGIDSLQALSLAIRMARDLLGSFVAEGGRILDPRSGADIDLDFRFGTSL
jgi:hypothetical protein